MRPQTPRPGGIPSAVLGSLGGCKKMVGLTQAWGFASPIQIVDGERRPWAGRRQLVGRGGGGGCGETGRGRDCRLGLMNRCSERKLGSKKRTSEFKIPEGEHFEAMRAPYGP